jgi:hypothetical protein
MPPGTALGRRWTLGCISARVRPRHDGGVLVTERPIPRTERVTADEVWRASQEPPAKLRAPARPEGDEVVWAIDRWNNEGGFVPEADLILDSWLRRRGPGWSD